MNQLFRFHVIDYGVAIEYSLAGIIASVFGLFLIYQIGRLNGSKRIKK